MDDRHLDSSPRWLRIGLRTQTLTLGADNRVIARYPVSTASKGAGEKMDSEQTPRGLHIVRARIGAGLPPGAVLAADRRGLVRATRASASGSGLDFVEDPVAEREGGRAQPARRG